jgi:hypothetical protein
MVNLGLLLEESEPAAARARYERGGHRRPCEAMFNLGRLLGGERAGGGAYLVGAAGRGRPR